MDIFHHFIHQRKENFVFFDKHFNNNLFSTKKNNNNIENILNLLYSRVDKKKKLINKFTRETFVCE